MYNKKYMKYKDFGQYLEYRCFEENQSILDDDMPDFFDNWISNLDISEIITYSDGYANEIKSEIRMSLLKLTQ